MIILLVLVLLLLVVVIISTGVGRLDEIEGCERSKWQILLVFLGRAVLLAPMWACPCRLALGGLLERLGGGPLHLRRPAVRRVVSFMSPLRAARECKSFWAEELFPPGRLAYFRPLAQEPLLCGYCLRDCRTAAHWAEPEGLSTELVLSTRTLELHFPWVIRDISARAARGRGRHGIGWLPDVGAFLLVVGIVIGVRGDLLSVT
ncbi:unnamed protein product [Prorocentrum cordatum]|uniref:Uncharacterized protein n=1 Tax=Prorocentrum cordatum TaxID=2364126 RepID=A0ABN9VBM4_9DINO|nr:unnamed protein product [Polarella glacialis]